jgi:hypothetical protein
MATYLDGIDGGKHNSDDIEVKTKTFTVSLTFDSIVAENPLDAAKTIAGWLLANNGANEMIYDVEDEETSDLYTVDLSEEEGNATLPG